MRFALIISVLSVLPPGWASGQSENPCTSLSELIRTTYNFKPSRVSEQQRKAKSEAMDEVWSRVRGNRDELAPCLRTALEEANADRWFRFDGGMLLAEVDPSPTSKALQIQAMSAVDLDDVDLRIWVMTLAQRGLEDFDVSEAGERWLSYPKAKYFLPEHGAFEVKSFEGALFIYGSMEESQATPALLRVAKQANHPGRESALWILMSQATPDSFGALKQIDPAGLSQKAQDSLQALVANPKLLASRAKPMLTRGDFTLAFRGILNGKWNYFEDLVERVSDGEKDAVAVLKPEDLPLVRKVRRLMISKANQHAIEYYNSFTDILMTLTWKPELVK